METISDGRQIMRAPSRSRNHIVPFSREHSACIGPFQLASVSVLGEFSSPSPEFTRLGGLAEVLARGCGFDVGVGVYCVPLVENSSQIR